MYYDPMECGMRISKLRMECGKTQQQMADKLNISLDHYRALENGRRGGSLDLLIELAITFDISLDYLILGRVKYSDTERIQRELENIMGQIGQLKASLLIYRDKLDQYRDNKSLWKQFGFGYNLITAREHRLGTLKTEYSFIRYITVCQSRTGSTP